MQSILDAINEWIKEILIGAINGLVSIAERREQQRQAAIRQFVKRCEALYEQQRKERRN